MSVGAALCSLSASRLLSGWAQPEHPPSRPHTYQNPAEGMHIRQRKLRCGRIHIAASCKGERPNQPSSRSIDKCVGLYFMAECNDAKV